MTHPKALAASKNLGLDSIEYKEFFAELKSSVIELIKELKVALLEKDGLHAAEIIHSIKGSVGSLGLMDTHKICQFLENEYKKGINENSMELFKEFNRIYDSEFREIEQTL